MRALSFFVFLLACGASPTTGPIDGGPSDAATNEAATEVDTGAMGNCNPACMGTNVVCDPQDDKCKPDGTRTNIGAPCDTSGADPKCGTDPRATCNDQTQDGFPGGYCSYEPCSATQLCPIGSSCARLGGESSACFKNCASDADCQNRPNGMDYECLAVDPLFTSGASHEVCYLKLFACANKPDCPMVKPTCVNEGGAGVCQ